ncbi:MAG TPA: hypothetical protein VMF13_07295 [Luteitalea sp.]|nr:hypothetical protein [Luteitalea sp.]
MERHPDPTTSVDGRLALLTPTWTPDLSRGRQLVAARHPRRGRHGLTLALATAAAVVVLACLPQGRALAQDLWYRLLVTRVEVVRLDLSQIPLDTSIRTDGLQRTVADATEATRVAGFEPTLPPVDTFATPPDLGVMGVIDITQRIGTATLTDALSRQGITDVEIPATWNGLALRAHIGPLVVATYRDDDIEIVQAPPVRLELPAGFPLARFAETVFRAGGLSWWEARAFGERFAARPAWLLDVPADAAATIETIDLASGDALLVEDVEDGLLRTTLVISRPDRLLTISAPTRARALHVAGQLQ